MNYLYLAIFFVSIFSHGYSHTSQATITKTSLYDKRAGAIIVSAIGDALGRVTEFIDTTHAIQKKYGPQGVTSFESFIAKDWVDNTALFTDDTLMAKLLLEVALDAQKNNVMADVLISNYAHVCIPYFNNQSMVVDPYCHYRAHGPTNINGMQILDGMFLHIQEQHKEKNKDEPEKKNEIVIQPEWWNRCPKNNTTTRYAEFLKEGGCGSVMRAWPLGLVYHDNSALLCELAEKQSILTHRHPMARAASCAIAVGVAAAMNNKNLDEIVNEMVVAASRFDAEELLYKSTAKKIQHPSECNPALIAKDAMLTSDMILYAYHCACNGVEPDSVLGVTNRKQFNHRSPQGYLLGWAADEAVAAAVYVFARHPHNSNAALIESVNTPGDSDSIASLAGALLGAYNGLNAFDQTGFNYQKLEKREELLALAQQIST